MDAESKLQELLEASDVAAEGPFYEWGSYSECFGKTPQWGNSLAQEGTLFVGGDIQLDPPGTPSGDGWSLKETTRFIVRGYDVRKKGGPSLGYGKLMRDAYLGVLEEVADLKQGKFTAHGHSVPSENQSKTSYELHWENPPEWPTQKTDVASIEVFIDAKGEGDNPPYMAITIISHKREHKDLAGITHAYFAQLGIDEAPTIATTDTPEEQHHGTEAR